MRTTSIGHAGLLIETDAGSILCDPWFVPAFFGSWFVFPRNDQLPADLQERIEHADYLYISHLHGDHHDEPWLRAHLRRDIPILLPGYPSREQQRTLERLGFDYFADVFPGRYENVAAAVARGTELEARVLPARGWSLDGSLTLVKTRVESGGFGGSLADGRALLRRPERSATAAIARAGSRGSISLRAAHVGARSDVRFFQDAPWSAEETLPAYTKVDLSGELPIHVWRPGSDAALTLRIDNVFDARYEPAAGYRAPGISFLAGARARF